MGFDAFLPAIPARVKALVLPIGQIKQSRFISFVQRLEQENVVRLGDVSPDGRPNRTMFSPLAFPDGRVLYDISSSYPSPSQPEIVPFELYRLPLLVIGILDGGQFSQDRRTENIVGENSDVMHNPMDAASQNLERLREDYPLGLVHRVLIFDVADIPHALPEDIALVPPLARSKTTTVKTVMCDLTSIMLAEMDPYAKSLQSHSTIDTPRASMATVVTGNISASPSHMIRSSRPTSVGPESRSSSPSLDAKLSYRMSVPAYVPSGTGSRSSTPISIAATPPSGRHTPPQPFEEKNGNAPIASPQRTTSSDRTKPGSQEQIAMGGFGSGSLGERERTRGKARVGVVIGALYLLAGRWPDALKELSTGAMTARANSDYVWQAKAMDYLLIPEILRPVTERPSSSKSSKHSVSNSQHEFAVSMSSDPEKKLVTLQSLAELIPNILNSILNLYGRAFTFTDDKLPSSLLSDSYVRFAKLLTALNLSQRCLNEETLRHIVNGSSLLRTSPESTEYPSIQGKSDIASLLMRAYPNASVDSSEQVSERLTVLCAISAVLSDLGYHRKRAVVLKDILFTLLPALVQARKERAAEMGLHPAASLSSYNVTKVDEYSAPLSMDSYGTGGSLRVFLHIICHSFGIVLQQSANVGQKRHLSAFESNSSPVSQSTLATLQQAIANAYGPQDIKADVLRFSINVCEALPDLEGVLKYSAVLLRTAGSSIAPGQKADNGSPDLTTEEQVRLANNISRTLSAAQYLGVKNPEADYWDEFLVRGIEVMESSQARRPIPHAKPELEIAQHLEVERETNPFIYNPFLKTKSLPTKPILVAMEEATIQLMMQNLYEFDILIDNIVLETDGVQLMYPPQAVRIGPYRTQTININVVPQTSGSLTITGCKAKIRGCRKRVFGIFTEPWALKVDMKGRSFLLASPTEKSKSAAIQQEPIATLLSIDVIEDQPLLILKSTSILQSALMLLEGEKSTFHFTLFNTSPNQQADFFFLSFTDSISAQMQDALASKEFSASESYELELSAAEKPSLSWKGSQDSQNLTVKPNSEIDLEIEILGKSGLTYANIQVDYSFLGIPQSELKERFFSRQVSIPISITVKATLDLDSNDIWTLQDFSSTGSERSWQNHDSTPQLQLLSDIGIADTYTPFCLVLLDFRNFFYSTLTLRLCCSPPGTDTTSNTLEHRIHPSTTIRIPVPIPRTYLPTSHSHAPIPSLNPASKRQFIVSAIKPTAEGEREAREAFWYREEILKLLNATWVEESTGKTGVVDLRKGLKLTPRMIAAYKLDDLDIQMSVHPAAAAAAAASTSKSSALDDETRLETSVCTGKYQVPTTAFLVLKTNLRNRSDAPIRPLLRLQPTLANQPCDVALDLSRKLLVNGVLQRALPPLGPGEERSVETGFLVLSSGVYEWRASVEEVFAADGKISGIDQDESKEGKAGRARARTGEMDLRVEERGRRTWVAERGCIVVARDVSRLWD